MGSSPPCAGATYRLFGPYSACYVYPNEIFGRKPPSGRTNLRRLFRKPVPLLLAEEVHLPGVVLVVLDQVGKRVQHGE